MATDTTAPRDPVKTSARVRPMTGDEYLESIRDGREIWIYGERVKDVTTHPAFRNTVRMIARLYDALHDPARQAVLTAPTDTGSGGFTHKFYLPSKNAEELVGARDAIAEWARVTYGWIGRSPDYKAAFLATLGANAAFYAPYDDNARRWYKKVQEEVSFVNHAIVNPPVDRDKPLDEVKDVYMHVEKETDGGLIVSGAKVVATTSSLTHYNFIANNGALPIKTKEFRLRLHRADRRAGREAVLPAVLRDDGRPSWARRSTTRCRAGWTRTTRSWSSTRCSCPRRTCSPTATSTRSTTSSRARASCRASCSRAARGSR